MNYEKKYNEILAWAKKYKARLNGVPIEDIFPELRESEDERIINAIIGILKNSNAIDINVSQEKMLSWLEKQKEQEHICDSAQYEEGFKTGLEIGLRKQKEQMMKGAVEGEVENASFGIVYLRKNLANDGYSTGDKVRIIIVKEDEK